MVKTKGGTRRNKTVKFGHRLGIRLSESDFKLLDIICKFNGLDKSRMIRKLIRSEYESLPNRVDKRVNDIDEDSFWEFG